MLSRHCTRWGIISRFENKAANTDEGGKLRQNCQIKFPYILHVFHSHCHINKYELAILDNVSFRNSRTFQGLLSQFKDFSRLYANSRAFQDKQSNSRAFQYCTNPGLAFQELMLSFRSATDTEGT